MDDIVNRAKLFLVYYDSQLAEFPLEKTEVYQALAEYARALLAEHERIKELEAKQAWQPIETAPRDGTEIDLWIQTWRGQGYRETSCHFHCSEWLKWSGEPEIGYLRPERDDERKATHWMPLPEPPK